MILRSLILHRLPPQNEGFCSVLYFEKRLNPKVYLKWCVRFTPRLGSGSIGSGGGGGVSLWRCRGLWPRLVTQRAVATHLISSATDEEDEITSPLRGERTSPAPHPPTHTDPDAYRRAVPLTPPARRHVSAPPLRVCLDVTVLASAATGHAPPSHYANSRR